MRKGKMKRKSKKKDESEKGNVKGGRENRGKDEECTREG